MAHFAKIQNNIVETVIVAEQDFINSLPDYSSWIQTSYNTAGGVHRLGGIPLRKNFASVGYTYDTQRDAFIPPKPFESWLLNEETCLWESPVAVPNDNNKYYWDESIINWVPYES